MYSAAAATVAAATDSILAAQLNTVNHVLRRTVAYYVDFVSIRNCREKNSQININTRRCLEPTPESCIQSAMDNKV